MKPTIAAAASGFLFAIGLAVGGMTDPAKVVGFLDVGGAWDPTLAFVMAGAMGTHAALRALVHKRKRPLLAPSFPSVSKSRVDARLLAGSALFGVGWGLAGYCPGPALVSLSTGAGTVGLFVVAMFAGMMLFQILNKTHGDGGVPSQSGAERAPHARPVL